MAKYNYTNYDKFNNFIEHLPVEYHEQFKAVIAEGQFLGRTLLQASLDAFNSVAYSIFTAVVMHRAWLQLSGFPREIQNTVEGLPFDELKLFIMFMDESLL